MTLRDMLEKAKFSFSAPFEKRVFVGGNYDFMPVLRNICDYVKKAGFEPVLPFDFDIPQDMIYSFDIGLLRECKYAIFEVSSGNGHMLELKEAIDSKKIMFCFYGVRGRRYSKPPPAVSSMLTTADIVLLGYDSFQNLKEIIHGIFPEVEKDLSSALLRVLNIAHVPRGARSRLISTLEGSLNLNGLPVVVAPSLENYAWTICNILHKKHPRKMPIRKAKKLYEILVRQKNLHYVEDNRAGVLEEDERDIVDIISRLQKMPRSPQTSDLLCIVTIALSRFILPNEAIRFLRKYKPATHPSLSFEYHLCLADCYYQINDFESALFEISKALKVENIDVEDVARGKLLYATIFLSSSQRERYDDVVSTLKWVLKNSGNSDIITQANFLHAYVLDQKCTYETALEIYSDLLKTSALRKSLEIVIRNNRGLEHLKLGMYEEALSDFQRCLLICEDDEWSTAAVHGNIGLVLMELGDLKDALEHSQKALKIYEEIGYKAGIANQHCNVGLVLKDLGNLKEALKQFQEALKIYEEIGDKVGIGGQQANVGLVLKDLGNLKEALKQFQEALKIYEEIKYRLGIAHCYNAIGFVLMELGDLKDALEHSQKALKIYEEIGYKAGIGDQEGSIGLVLKDLGNLKEALEHSQKALKIYEEIGYKVGIANQHSNIGNIFWELGNLAESLRSSEESLRILNEIGAVARAKKIQKDIDSVKKSMG